jgi:uncharacterized repeat protein (TIGR03837 family)
MQWDLFCRVIDNHGDLGVCWRLACDLAGRGQTVRLCVDDASALAWMAPGGAAGVQVCAWTEQGPPDVGEVVIEAFGCDPPPPFVRAMAARHPAPMWINLEYLSAEAYVERSHGLPSPQPCGLTKWFFYPGLTARTGGLLREPRLMQALRSHDGPAWLAARGWTPRSGERVISRFCYDQPRLGEWLPLLAAAPTLLLATAGHATRQLQALARPAGLRVIQLPWLTQADYDRLLWSCDLNAVRGEDSFVRAHWAGRPMLWHIYPQYDGAHAAKLEAWLDRCLDGAPAAAAAAIRQGQRHWNGLGPAPAELPGFDAWRALQQAWRERLLAQDDLTTQLMAFVVARQGQP